MQILLQLCSLHGGSVAWVSGEVFPFQSSRAVVVVQEGLPWEGRGEKRSRQPQDLLLLLPLQSPTAEEQPQVSRNRDRNSAPALCYTGQPQSPHVTREAANGKGSWAQIKGGETARGGIH